MEFILGMLLIVSLVVKRGFCVIIVVVELWMDTIGLVFFQNLIQNKVYSGNTIQLIPINLKLTLYLNDKLNQLNSLTMTDYYENRYARHHGFCELFLCILFSLLFVFFHLKYVDNQNMDSYDSYMKLSGDGRTRGMTGIIYDRHGNCDWRNLIDTNPFWN